MFELWTSENALDVNKKSSDHILLFFASRDLSLQCLITDHSDWRPVSSNTTQPPPPIIFFFPSLYPRYTCLRLSQSLLHYHIHYKP